MEGCSDCDASGRPEDYYSLVYVPVSLPATTDMLAAAAESEDLLRYFSSSTTTTTPEMDTDGMTDFMEEAEESVSTEANLLDLAASGVLSAEDMSEADHGYLNGILNVDGETV